MSSLMSKMEYRLFSDSTNQSEWNVPLRLYEHTRIDYQSRVKLSGLWIGVVLKWHPQLVKSYAGAPITNPELIAMDGLQSTEQFIHWWSCILMMRKGAAPSDLIETIVTNNRLQGIVDSYAEPKE